MNKAFSSVGIYTDSFKDDQSLLENIYSDLVQTHNIIIFSDDINTVGLYNMAIFPSFHMTYFRGSVIFLSLESFLYHKENIIAHPLLYSNGSMKDLDRSIISKDNIYEIR